MTEVICGCGLLTFAAHSGSVIDVNRSRSLLLLRESDVLTLFTPEVAFESQIEAFKAHQSPESQVSRSLLQGKDGSYAFCYGARTSLESAAVSKFGSVVPGNTTKGLPSVTAIITILDEETGYPIALIEGTSITTLRTAAASAVAVSTLKPSVNLTVAVLGSGVQALAHCLALARLEAIVEITLVARNLEAGQHAANQASTATGRSIKFTPLGSTSLKRFDVIATCTTSSEPLIHSDDVSDGTLVLSIGSYAPDRSELATGLLTRANLVVVDDIAIACTQAGSIMRALATGALTREELRSLSQIIVDGPVENVSSNDVIVYNSVGLGIQDATAALAILREARSSGQGVNIAW